jgi:hypothetical protein
MDSAGVELGVSTLLNSNQDHTLRSKTVSPYLLEPCIFPTDISSSLYALLGYQEILEDL